MSQSKIIPVDPSSVLHQADEDIFQRKLKLKEEQLDEWPYYDQEEYMKSLQKLAQKYDIKVDYEGKGSKKVDYRLVNRFVSSLPDAFLEYKKKSNVSQVMKKYKFIVPDKTEHTAKIKAILT